MIIIQEFQKNQERKIEFQNLQENCLMQEIILLIFLKKELYLIKKKRRIKKERTKKFFEYVENESKDINYDLMENYFDLVAPTVLAKELFETKDKNKNSELVELIKVRWSNLKDETKKMSEREIENEKPDKILKIVEEILDFNNKIQKQQG